MGQEKIELYLGNGEKAGLYDVCRWWIETYPADVFVHNPHLVVEIRKLMQQILIKEWIKC